MGEASLKLGLALYSDLFVWALWMNNDSNPEKQVIIEPANLVWWNHLELVCSKVLIEYDS